MAKKTLTPEEITTESTMGRRAAVASVGGIALGGAALALGMTQPARALDDGAEPLCTDRDPSDPAGGGRHCSACSDSDPRDPAGHGVRCGRPSCSDSDPTDPGGWGRHCW